MNKIKPQYFDLLGILSFPFILGYALYEILTESMPPMWVSVILALIGIGGVIIDGQIVWHYFIKKDRS